MTLSVRAFLTLAVSGIVAPVAAAPPGRDALVTVAERSGFTRTGRYDEVPVLCDAFAKQYPDAVRCVTFGTTPEGRPMKALIVSRSGTLDAATARQRRLPVVLIQGGIHSGEIDGKDAGFLALRELLDGSAAPGVLEKLVWVFVPVFSVDGHERFARWNRPNQRGPEEMGFRTTAEGYNLNRDYIKADAPEMQAMLRLIDEWDPLAAVDLHVTDGAKFEHDISIQVEPVHGGDPELATAGKAFRAGVVADLARDGSLPLDYYPSFVVEDDPTSGFEDNVPTARFSHGYFLLRNRFGMLVETHSWKTYPVRVKITRNTIVSVLEHVARHGTAWLALAHAADARASRLGGTPVALAYHATDKTRMVDFRGYAYTRTHSDVSGALMTHYDETKPEIWHIPLKYDVQPSLVVDAPRGGYVVPAAFAAMVEPRLALHGLQYRRVGDGAGQRPVEVFRATRTAYAAASSEGRQRISLQGAWQPETRPLAANDLYVPIAQPNARLAMTVFEPLDPDSLVAWGLFNNAFEHKEYMEDYVAEDVARDMLRDSAVKAAFEARLASDPAFAADPQARLDYFYQRHESWDERFNLYPVLRVDVAPGAGGN